MGIRAPTAFGSLLSRGGVDIAARRAGIDEHSLPQIFHYWSNKYLKPKFEALGFRDPDAFYLKYAGACLKGAREGSKRLLRIASLGSGTCDTEITLVAALVEAGHRGFIVECIEPRPTLLERGMVRAHEEKLDAHLVPIAVDPDVWQPDGPYDVIIANHALHRSARLEHIFDTVRRSLAPGARFIVSAYIGRNGHRRWPEALEIVHRFWKELPAGYRYNIHLDRVEAIFADWDYAKGSTDGLRSEEILPNLVNCFGFDLFVAYANVIEPFVGRAFGHNFNAEAAWDRAFIDRVHACDEGEISAGRIKPTHMLAVLSAERPGRLASAGVLTPESALRKPS